MRGKELKRNNIDKCKDLRKKQTDAEKKLWGILRNRQIDKVKFRRQFPVGSYILDFYCPKYKLGIEADGSQHYDDQGINRDEIRTKELSKLGIKIIRFNDSEILRNIEGVAEAIQKAIKNMPPSPISSPPEGEEN